MEWLLAAVIGYALMPLLAAFTSSYAARPRSRHDSGRNPDTRPLLRPPMLLISIPASAASYAESSGWVLVPNCGPHMRNSGSRESERTSRRKSRVAPHALAPGAARLVVRQIRTNCIRSLSVSSGSA